MLLVKPNAVGGGVPVIPKSSGARRDDALGGQPASSDVLRRNPGGLDVNPNRVLDAAPISPGNRDHDRQTDFSAVLDYHAVPPCQASEGESESPESIGLMTIRPREIDHQIGSSLRQNLRQASREELEVDDQSQASNIASTCGGHVRRAGVQSRDTRSGSVRRIRSPGPIDCQQKPGLLAAISAGA